MAPVGGSFDRGIAVTTENGYAFENMPDQLSALYSDFLEGSYDCVDRVILNAYFDYFATESN